MIVAIPRAERAALDEGEVYIGDLIGCVLVDVAGARAELIVGEIEDVDRTAGPVAMLVVRGKSARRDSDSVCEGLSATAWMLEAKRVEMALPEGLVDLNETKQS